MIELICGTYEHVFMIDEPRDTVVRATKDELPDLVDHRGNRNLVAASNPGHVEIIQTLLRGRTQNSTS